MTNMLTLEQHNEFYKELHKTPKFNGYSLFKHIPELFQLIHNSNITSVLDFGCGKGLCWLDFRLDKLFKLERLGLYDPGVEKFSHIPNVTYDMVICIDVLEHIPEHLLDEVLEQIFSKAEKLVFLSISTRPASKKLPNGDNAHATIKPKQWWLDRLKEYNILTITHFD